MVYITILCSLGMSTSMIVDNMLGVAKEKGIEVDIDALPFDKADMRLEKTDILLISPQIRHMLGKFKEKYDGKIKVIGTIDVTDFGLVRGEKILDSSLKQLNEKEANNE
ncbi:PTS sugar transporter subunit IIB [Clostridia bacterium]|nr:PTS sugar transporter subunit IIB [Clostridia bacterium]